MQSFFKNTIKQSRWYNVSQCKTMRWMNTTTTTTNRNLLKAYRVLNVTSDATQDQIKLAYLKKVKATHPDQNPDSETAAGAERVAETAREHVTQPAHVCLSIFESKHYLKHVRRNSY